MGLGVFLCLFSVFNLYESIIKDTEKDIERLRKEIEKEYKEHK